MGSNDTRDDTTPTPAARTTSRRRASRAAGPARDDVGPVELGISLERPVTTTAPRVTRVGAPPRRQPSRGPLAVVGMAVLTVVALVLGAAIGYGAYRIRGYDAAQARDQRFVSTAEQTVINMFSYTQDTIDVSVDRFYNGISGPLRDMMAQGNNRDNLKAIFRQTQASSEAVVSGAALEKVDEIAKSASVLVAVRVTVTDLDGVNAPSKPYRLRVIVREADDGSMTGYDLKYPDGGN